MIIFLNVLFTYITLRFLSIATKEGEFPELRIQYAIATAFMCALIFMLYRL